MSQPYNDDLFEDTKMSFGDHLEELRGVLFKSMFGLIAGFLIGLLIANHVVTFVQTPLKKALDEYYITKAKDEMQEKYAGAVPPEMLNTIVNDGLILKFEHIEARSILECLKVANPERFADVEYVPYQFTTEDLVEGKLPALCEDLVEDGNDDDDSPAKLLWALMTSEQQQTVREIAGKEATDEDDREAFAEILRDVSNQREVHESDPFNDITLSENDQKVVDDLRTGISAEFDADESRHLNKILIAAAFEKQLRQPRVQTVSVRVWRPTEVRVQSLNAHESFMIWVKAGFVSGLVIASPWIFWQIWTFVAAGLYPHEKNFVWIFLPFSIVLFLAGAAMAFFFVFEPVLGFLFSFNRKMNIDPDPRIGEWLSFVLILPLGFGIAFQLPLVMFFINRLGILSVEQYVKKWRMAILVIFVASMFLTPADPISMMLMAGPLTILYFLGIALCQWMPRSRRRFAEAYEP